MDYLYDAAGAEDLRRERLPAGRAEPSSSKLNFPTPAELFTIDDLGGWNDGHEEVLRPGERRSSPRSSSTGGRPRQAEPVARRVYRRRPASRRSRSASDVGVVDGLPEPDRPDPARGARLGSRPTAGWTASGTRSPRPQAVAALELTLVASVVVALDQRGHGHADRVGARARRLPRARASSTRSSTCRSRCPRSSPG